MKMKCAYCGKKWQNKLKLAPGLPAGTISHGICENCAEILDTMLDVKKNVNSIIEQVFTALLMRRRSKNYGKSGKL